MMDTTLFPSHLRSQATKMPFANPFTREKGEKTLPTHPEHCVDLFLLFSSFLLNTSLVRKTKQTPPPQPHHCPCIKIVQRSGGYCTPVKSYLFCIKDPPSSDIKLHICRIKSELGFVVF